MISKHQALYNWVNSFLDNNDLYYERADAYPNVKTLVPNYGDYINYTDIYGNRYRSYSFIFIGYETLDPVNAEKNIDNMEIFDEFTRWLEDQKELMNTDLSLGHPDFGEKCSDYEIFPLQNMANIATITEDGMAKYMLGVRIDYKEEE